MGLNAFVYRANGVAVLVILSFDKNKPLIYY